MVLDALAHAGREHWAGWLYTGIGGGIAGSGLFVALTHGAVAYDRQWLILGAVAAAFAILPFAKLHDRDAPATAPAAAHAPAAGQVHWGPLLALTAAYFLEGGGYIVTGTFLPAIMAADPVTQPWAGWAWTAAGIAAIPSGIFWVAFSRRFGLWAGLIAAHLAQASGIVLPLSGTGIAGIASAMLFGGTFVGIVSLSFQLGRRLAAGASTKVVGLLTAVYGLGQILGPLAASQLAAASGHYDTGLAGAALAVLTGAGLLALGMVAESRLRERLEECR
jgi:hypothetical protein